MTRYKSELSCSKRHNHTQVGVQVLFGFQHVFGNRASYAYGEVIFSSDLHSGGGWGGFCNVLSDNARWRGGIDIYWSRSRN
jgi:hypothetical protein